MSKLAELFGIQASDAELPHNNPLSLSAEPLGEVIEAQAELVGVDEPSESSSDQSATTDGNP
jgi:hypothetical protein